MKDEASYSSQLVIILKSWCDRWNSSESSDKERNRLEQMVGVMLDLKRRINSEIVMRSTYQSQGSKIIYSLDFVA